MGITRTLLTKLFVLAFAASTATWALAQGPRFGDPHGPGGPVGGVAPLAMLLLDPQVYGALGLTAEQQALWTALQTAEQAARAQRDAGRTTVQALVASEFAGGARRATADPCRIHADPGPSCGDSMNDTTAFAAPMGGNVTYSCELPVIMFDAAPLPLLRVPLTPSAELPRSPPRAPRPARAAALRIAVRFAGWELDLVERRLIAPGGGTERLPGLEFALLRTFVTRARRPLSRQDLANLLTRDGGSRLSGRTVDTYVSRLRRRLRRGGSASLITTVRTLGYCFDADIVQA